VAFAKDDDLPDDPFFEGDMKRPADPATDLPGTPRDGVAVPLVE